MVRRPPRLEARPVAEWGLMALNEIVS